MKLTLRTLLAFLDGTIGEDDAAALRKKIRESESIRDLIARIRSVISQPQLPAPKSKSGGMAGDPNLSSEYIDNSLDPELVAEFEKLTIGSDILLSEVAEAHQILAKLAEVDAGVSGRLRNRLYKATEAIYKAENDEPEMFPVIEDHSSIQEEYDDVDTGKSHSGSEFNLAPPVIHKGPPIDDDPSGDSENIPPVAPPIDTASSPSTRSRRIDSPKKGFRTKDDATIPPRVQAQNTGTSDPENEHKNQNKTGTPRARLLPVIFATACITALIVLAVMTFWNPNGNQVAGGPENSDTPETKELDDSDPDSEKTNAVDDSSDSKQAKTNDEKSNETAATNSQEKPDIKTDVEAQTKLVPKKMGLDKNDSNKKQDQQANAKKSGEDEVLNLFKDKDYDKKGKSDPAMKNAADKSKPGKEKAKEAEKKKAETVSPLTNTRKLMAKDAELANGDAVGMLKTALQPTLRKTNLPEAKLIVLAQEKPLFVNDTVVALPECQSKIEILESVRINLFGFCQLELQDNEGEVLPLINVQTGIVSFENMKDPNNTVDVMIDGKKLQVTFVDKESRFCVVNFSQPGLAGSSKVVQLAAIQGRALCKFGGEILSLDAKQMLSLKGDKFETVSFSSEPEALQSSTSSLTQSAKETFFALGLENPVFKVTKEKALSDTRSYVRKFAAMSAFALGDFDALIRFFNDAENKSFWPEVFQFARERVLADESLQNRFREYCYSPEKEGGKEMGTLENRKSLYQFLTVHSDKQLENALDKELVDGLQHKELWIRVAAIQALDSITGLTKFYRPEDEEDKRRKPIKAWEKLLEEEKIRIAKPFLVSQFE